MSELFTDLTAANAVWGRDRRGAAPWHLLGPRLPRIAPVSPRLIIPCGGEALHSDSLETSKDPAVETRCSFCHRFLESRAH
jgi:hypothetical protein